MAGNGGDEREHQWYVITDGCGNPVKATSKTGEIGVTVRFLPVSDGWRRYGGTQKSVPLAEALKQHLISTGDELAVMGDASEEAVGKINEIVERHRREVETRVSGWCERADIR